MAGPLRGSFHGTPYEISADRRSGTVTVSNPKDGSSHVVSVVRGASGILNATAIDGHSISSIMAMSSWFVSDEQKAGIRSMVSMIRGASSQVTREINKADGIPDPAEEEAKKAKLLREAELKEREADKLAQAEARRRADEDKRRQDKPAPPVVEGRRDIHAEPPPPTVIEPPPDHNRMALGGPVPLPRSDPRKAKVTPVADTRPIDNRREPKKEADRRLTGKGEKHRIAEGTVHYGKGETAGSLRLRNMKNGRTMVFRDPHTKLSELLHGPKRDAAFRVLREKLGEVHDAPHRRELKFMYSVMTHLGKKENKAEHPALRHREHIVEANARPLRDLQPRPGMRPLHRTALMPPIDGEHGHPEDVTRQARAQIQRGGPKGPGFFG